MDLDNDAPYHMIDELISNYAMREEFEDSARILLGPIAREC